MLLPPQHLSQKKLIHFDPYCPPTKPSAGALGRHFITCRDRVPLIKGPRDRAVPKSSRNSPHPSGPPTIREKGPTGLMKNYGALFSICALIETVAFRCISRGIGLDWYRVVVVIMFTVGSCYGCDMRVWKHF